MINRLSVIIALAIACAGCANIVYRWNMEHANVAEHANLSGAEVEQIIRAVTQKSLRMILEVTRSQENGHDRVIVYTAEGPDEGGMMVYRLERSGDGLWRIVSYGRGDGNVKAPVFLGRGVKKLSFFVAGLALAIGPGSGVRGDKPPERTVRANVVVSTQHPAAPVQVPPRAQ